jgi:hypothetical protein
LAGAIEPRLQLGHALRDGCKVAAEAWHDSFSGVVDRRLVYGRELTVTYDHSVVDDDVRHAAAGGGDCC